MATATPTEHRPLGLGLRLLLESARAVLAVALVAEVAVGLWHWSLPGDPESLLDDLRAGEVTVLEIGPGPAERPLIDVGSVTVVRWRTADDRWRAFALDDVHLPAMDPILPGDTRDEPPPRDAYTLITMMDGEDSGLAERIARAYAPHRDTVVLRETTDNPLQWWLGLIAGSVWLPFLVVLVAGPQPGRATKWAWFWLSALPLNAGLLAYLTMDSPWTSPRPVGRRLTGGRAFGLAILVSFGWALVTLALG